LLPAAR